MHALKERGMVITAASNFKYKMQKEVSSWHYFQTKVHITAPEQKPV